MNAPHDSVATSPQVDASTPSAVAAHPPVAGAGTSTYEPARFDTLPCSRCHGTGSLPDRHHERDGECRKDCDDCEGTGSVVTQERGSYALADGRTQLKGEPLPALHTLPERLLDWARTLAAHLQQDGARNRFPFAAEMRDDLALLAHAVEEHVDQLGEAATARELEGDKRDDELAALHEYVATLEAENEQLRERGGRRAS